MADEIGFRPITEALLNEIADADYVSLDTETSGLLFDSEVLGISVAWKRKETYMDSLYLNLGHMSSLFFPFHSQCDARALVSAVMQADKVFFQNAPFDLERLARWNMLPEWPKPNQLVDCQPTARMAFPFYYKESVSLAHLTDRFAGGFPAAAKEMKKMRNRLAELPAERVEGYAKADAESTLKVGLHLLDQMYKVYDPVVVKELLEREARFLMLLTRMQLRGVLLDVEYINMRAVQLKEERDMLAARLWEAGVENPGSNPKIAAFLIEKGHALARTKKGNPCVNADALKQVGGPVAKDILQWRGLNKAISTWLDGFLGLIAEDGRIHPRFYAAGTISGRISCRKPNLQAIPLEDRGDAFGAMMGIFAAAPGHSIHAYDYAQAELRLATAYAGSNKMAEIFHSGKDAYTETAKGIWPDTQIDSYLRQLAKQVNLTLIYGGGAFALAEECNISEAEARRLRKKHQVAFPVMTKMIKLASKTWLQRRYLRLLSGRFRWLGEGEEERVYKAFNQLVQGGIAEIVKTAMLDVDEYLQATDTGDLMLQIHDSIEIEIKDGASPGTRDAIKCTMARALPEWLAKRTTPRVNMVVSEEKWT